jgi:hypothetical protein
LEREVVGGHRVGYPLLEPMLAAAGCHPFAADHFAGVIGPSIRARGATMQTQMPRKPCADGRAVYPAGVRKDTAFFRLYSDYVIEVKDLVYVIAKSCHQQRVVPDLQRC